LARYKSDVTIGITQPGYNNNELLIFPNPFPDFASIQFSLQNSTHVNINLFNLHGKKVKPITEGSFQAGIHHVNFFKEDMPGGVYILQIKTDMEILSQKLIIE
jgi:hypothetical protein